MNSNGRIAFSMKNIVIIGLVAVIAILAWQWYERQGDVRVDIGYILEDGTRVPIETGKTYAFAFDASTLSWYADPARTTKINGVYGTLSVKAEPNFDTDIVTIEWDGESAVGATSNSGSKSIAPHQWVTISESTMEAHGFWSAGNEVTCDMKYNVTATANGVTATSSASAEITIYWKANTLTLSVSTDIGTLNLTK